MDARDVTMMVHQWLREHGYDKTSAMLEQESGHEFTSSGLHRGGELMSRLNTYAELTTHGEPFVDMDELLQAGSGSWIEHACGVVKGVCGGKPAIGVCWEPGSGTHVVVGGATGVLSCYDASAVATHGTPPEVVWQQSQAFRGPVLCVSWSRKGYVLASSMTGEAVVLRGSDGVVIQRWKDHAKFVSRAVWNPSGDGFATASHDNYCIVYGCGSDSQCSSSPSASSSSPSSQSPSSDPEFKERKRFQLPGVVEAIAWNRSGSQLLIGARDDPYLHYVDAQSLEKRRVPLNGHDEHCILFTPLNISVRPDDMYVAVSTDKDRIAVYLADSCAIVRNFYGATSDSFANPRLCWSPCGKYAYSNAQDMSICVWDVATQRIVHRLRGHTGVIRDLSLSDDGRCLVSCSFDGSMRFWSIDECPLKGSDQ